MPPKPQDKMNKTGDAISASLYDAITSVSSSRVRAVLRDICDACPDAKKMAKNMLLVQKDDNAELFQYNEDEQLNDNGKRECPSHRYEVCERCGFEYDVLIDDDEDDCVWHEGELEIDEEYFADWDEPIELLESESYRRDFPEGFTWSCCEKDGNDDGCMTDRHMPKVVGKKARIRE